MQLYALTDLIGKRADEGRTITVMTVSVRPKVAWVVGLSTPVGLLVTAMLWPLLGYYAVLALPLVVVAAAWLFVSRTNDSREISQLKALSDKAQSRSLTGKVYLGTTPVDVFETQEVELVAGSVPVGSLDPRVGVLPTAFNFDEAMKNTKPRKK